MLLWQVDQLTVRTEELEAHLAATTEQRNTASAALESAQQEMQRLQQQVTDLQVRGSCHHCKCCKSSMLHAWS